MEDTLHFYIIFRLPSRREDEALLHLDLCLEYMEIVDKQLVDEVPKMFIMMLVHKVILLSKLRDML